MLRYVKKNVLKWYEHWDGDVYDPFGGKIAPIIIVRLSCTSFSDTGLEYPEIKSL